MKVLAAVAASLLLFCSLGCNPAGDDAQTASVSETAADSSPGADAAAATATVPAPTASQAPGDAGSQWLSIGDPAPPLVIDTWVQGQPVTAFEQGRVYVVEFWATWCPPCRASMPHLSELQEKYADALTAIGVTDEDLDTVKSFLAKPSEANGDKTWSEVVDYTLATDSANATTIAYLQAAGQGGIPCAFIVGREGLVEWIGHPMAMDDPLSQVVAGTYDRGPAQAAFNAEQQPQRLMMAASRTITQAVEDGDYDTALTALEPLITQMPEAAQLRLMKSQLLQQAGRHDEASGVLDALAQEKWDDEQLLNGLAWQIATNEENPNRDFSLALKLAERAVELTAEQDGSALDTLARVYFEKGDLETAIQWQQKAVEAGGPYLEENQKTLEKYQAEVNGGETPPDEAAS